MRSGCSEHFDKVVNVCVVGGSQISAELFDCDDRSEVFQLSELHFADGFLALHGHLFVDFEQFGVFVAFLADEVLLCQLFLLLAFEVGSELEFLNFG